MLINSIHIISDDFCDLLRIYVLYINKQCETISMDLNVSRGTKHVGRAKIWKKDLSSHRVSRVYLSHVHCHLFQRGIYQLLALTVYTCMSRGDQFTVFLHMARK